MGLCFLIPDFFGMVPVCQSFPLYSGTASEMISICPFPPPQGTVDELEQFGMVLALST